MYGKTGVKTVVSLKLDNPTTILQQEEAKVFFTNNSDAKRYEFFFKATTLHA